MSKPKHLKRRMKYTRETLVSWIIVLSIVLICLLIIASCVPVSEASNEISVIRPDSEIRPSQQLEEWDLTTMPLTEPHDEEGSLMESDIVLTALDLIIPAGELYGVDDLDHWEEVAATLNVSNAAEVLKVINECRELLSYECYKGETLVQALAKTVTAEIGGLDDYGSYSTAKMEEAAVIWCILNRVDTYYAAGKAEHVEEIVKSPHQFAYRYWTKIHDGMEELVVDVLIRWRLEKNGLIEDCGRVLPAEYLFFHGDGHHNHFRIKYDDYNIYNFWDWSLPDPYKEE